MARPLSVRCSPAPASITRRAVRPQPRDWDALVRLVATSFAVPVADVTAPSRGSARAAFARQVAMYLAHVGFGATFSAIGRAFRRDRTTVAHAARIIEERRDDPGIDALLERLERDCAALAATICGSGTGAQ